jgi:two-component system phosphate regulon response regulator PhoB
MTGIVIISYDLPLYEAAEPALIEAGFRVFRAASAEAAQQLVVREAPGLMLLEWTGTRSARGFLATMAESATGAPPRVIVVAAQGDRDEAVQALNFGFEDCLLSPFSAAELLARVGAALRRPVSTDNGEHVSAGPIHLDKAAHRVFVAGQPLDFAPTEFRLLRFFLENQGRVFSRQELLERAWSNNVHAGPRTVDVHVRRLRQVLEPYSCDYMIQTVRGFGYRFSPLSHERAWPGLRRRPTSLVS